MDLDETWSSPEHYAAEERVDELSEALRRARADVLDLAETVMSMHGPKENAYLRAYQAAERARKPA